MSRSMQLSGTSEGQGQQGYEEALRCVLVRRWEGHGRGRGEWCGGLELCC